MIFVNKPAINQPYGWPTPAINPYGHAALEALGPFLHLCNADLHAWAARNMTFMCGVFKEWTVIHQLCRSGGPALGWTYMSESFKPMEKGKNHRELLRSLNKRSTPRKPSRKLKFDPQWSAQDHLVFLLTGTRLISHIYILSIYLSIYLSICLSIYLSIHPSICLSIYLTICAAPLTITGPLTRRACSTLDLLIVQALLLTKVPELRSIAVMQSASHWFGSSYPILKPHLLGTTTKPYKTLDFPQLSITCSTFLVRPWPSNGSLESQKELFRSPASSSRSTSHAAAATHWTSTLLEWFF